MPLSVKLAIGVVVGALTAMIISNPMGTLIMLGILGTGVAVVRILVFIVEDI